VLKIETCEQCGSAVKVIASIEDPVVIKQILDHLENRTKSPQSASHPVRAPPAHPELDSPCISIPTLRKRYQPGHRAAALVLDGDESPKEVLSHP